MAVLYKSPKIKLSEWFFMNHGVSQEMSNVEKSVQDKHVTMFGLASSTVAKQYRSQSFPLLVFPKSARWKSIFLSDGNIWFFFLALKIIFNWLEMFSVLIPSLYLLGVLLGLSLNIHYQQWNQIIRKHSTSNWQTLNHITSAERKFKTEPVLSILTKWNWCIAGWTTNEWSER